MNKEICKKIKIFRIKADMKQDELARQLDVTKNYISILENGKKTPSLQLIEKLSNALGVTMDMFFLPSVEDVNLSSKEQIEYYNQLLLVISKALPTISKEED